MYLRINNMYYTIKKFFNKNFKILLQYLDEKNKQYKSC